MQWRAISEIKKNHTFFLEISTNSKKCVSAEQEQGQRVSAPRTATAAKSAETAKLRDNTHTFSGQAQRFLLFYLLSTSSSRFVSQRLSIWSPKLFWRRIAATLKPTLFEVFRSAIWPKNFCGAWSGWNGAPGQARPDRLDPKFQCSPLSQAKKNKTTQTKLQRVTTNLV